MTALLHKHCVLLFELFSGAEWCKRNLYFFILQCIVPPTYLCISEAHDSHVDASQYIRSCIAWSFFLPFAVCTVNELAPSSETLAQTWLSGRSPHGVGGGRSPSDGPPQPQFQCDLKKNFFGTFST